MHTRQDVEAWLRCKDDQPDTRQIRIWRSMSAERKLSLAFDMYDFMKQMLRSHLQREHPEYAQQEIEALVRRRFTRRE